jgi:hypothetical protein
VNILTDAFNSWDQSGQIAFCLASLAILCLTILFSAGMALRSLRIVLRGYPPRRTFSTATVPATSPDSVSVQAVARRPLNATTPSTRTTKSRKT